MNHCSIIFGVIFTFGTVFATRADPAVDKFAIATLRALQPVSFKQGLEACGYIYRLNGRFQRTPNTLGRAGYCDSSPDDVPNGGVLVASFHNHGAFTEEFDSEVPTVEDISMDQLDGVVGYVGTPGGRVWKIKKGVARQLCRRCIASDPEHDDGYFLPIDTSYTKKALQIREREDSEYCRRLLDGFMVLRV